ncbi:MAG: restriction endonuclease [Verrucomicrobiota bacterium]
MVTKFRKSKGPQFVRYFGPVLDALRALGGSGSPSEVADKIAEMLQIPAKDQEELMGSGSSRFLNQVQWARFYLNKDGLVSSSERGVWALTDKSRNKALTHDDALEIFSRIHKVFQEQRRQSKEAEPKSAEETPEEAETEAAGSHREHLLNVIKSISSSGFEQLCQRLLREAGFKQVTVTGRTGDGGIDGVGILQINPFVSFQVLFQCKRYERSVSPSQVRDFRGAMEGRADKGIIITTGTFTSDARKEALRDGAKPIELVDGEKLIEMFESLRLGLKPIQTFEVDEDFFNDFREESKKVERSAESKEDS